MTKANKISWLIGAIVVVLVVIFVLTQPETEVPVEQEPIKIGVIVPLSGNGAVYGEWGRNALEIAKDEINNSGGVNGRLLSLNYEDGKFSPSETVEAFHKLQSIDNISYVLSLGSSPAVSISPLANEHQIIQIDFSATTAAYRSEGDFTFRTAPQAEQFGIDAARWLVDNNEDQVSVLYINNDQGLSIFDAFSQAYQKLNGQIIQAEKFEQDGTDFKSTITKSVRDDQHYVFLIGHLKESGLIVRQMNELGHFNPILSHVFSVEGETFLKTAGEFNNQIIYLAPDYNPDKNKATQVYDTKYQARYGETSQYFGAFAYDALQVLAKAMSACSDYKNTACVKQELFDIKGHQGLTGEITFDQFGDRLVDLSLKTIKDGQFVHYEE